MKLFLKKTATKGFTLIELLVVIGILGILAALLLATIDPIEQFNKAQDTNARETSVQFVEAATRYYSNHAVMPWSDVSPCVGTPPSNTQLSSLGNCMTSIINDGELKASFTGATAILQKIYITGAVSSVTACYLPSSKSAKRDTNTKYANTGAATTGCLSQGGTGSSCYYCVF